jgi:hypothetical protein
LRRLQQGQSMVAVATEHQRGNLGRQTLQLAV